MEKWQGRVALVTGASKGIGASAVRALVGHGMKVVAVARSLDILQKLAEELSGQPGSVYPFQCDLRNPEEIHNVFDQVKAHTDLGGVDVCINSAGLAKEGKIIDGDGEEWKEMWEVNVQALCYCTRAAVKSMKERNVNDGYIININSLSGHRVGMAHFYSVSKHAVTAITESIRWELRSMNSHIRVSSISPGLVETNFAFTYLGEDKGAKLYAEKPSLKVDDITESIIYLLTRPIHMQVHDILMRPTEQVS